MPTWTREEYQGMLHGIHIARQKLIPLFSVSVNESHVVYYANTYTFATIQVTRAAAEASRLKGISIVVPDFLANNTALVCLLFYVLRGR